MSAFEIKTIEDMERYYYGLGVDITKTDAPVLTTTTGIYNPVYGAKVWSQLNLEANLFALMPKMVWTQSGFRVMTVRAPIVDPTHWTIAPGGQAENTVLPDTTKPTWVQEYSKPKVIAHTFNASEVMEFLGTIDDSIGDIMGSMREYMGLHHAEHINIMMAAEGAAAGATQEGYDIQAIDRMLGSSTELALDMADGSTPIDDASMDLYTNGSTIDRDVDTWADAKLSYHASAGSLRSLTLDIMDDAFRQVWQAGGTPKVIVTGYDSLKAVQRLLQAQQRFVEYRTVVPTYGGVRGIEGIAAGFVVATYNGVPMIPTKNCLQDQDSATPPGISRIYLLDTDYMWVKVARPTQYFEAGISTGNPFSINYIGDKGMYRTMADLICNRFNTQCKIRDLKE